ERFEGVHSVEARSGTFGDHLAPLVAVDVAGQESKDGGSFIGHPQPPRDAVFIHEVFDAVFDAVTTGLEQGKLPRRIIGREIMHLRRRGRSQLHDDDRVVATAPHRKIELRVVLLKDEHVGARVGAEFVAPELERSLGVIDSRVEEMSTVRRPREAVVDVLEPVVNAGFAWAKGRTVTRWSSSPSKSVPTATQSSSGLTARTPTEK